MRGSLSKIPPITVYKRLALNEPLLLARNSTTAEQIACLSAVFFSLTRVAARRILRLLSTSVDLITAGAVDSCEVTARELALASSLKSRAQVVAPMVKSSCSDYGGCEGNIDGLVDVPSRSEEGTTERCAILSALP